MYVGLVLIEVNLECIVDAFNVFDNFSKIPY